MAITKLIYCANCGNKFKQSQVQNYFCTIVCRILVNIKVDKKTGCWLWQKGKFPNGYAQIKISGRTSTGAHRVCYQEIKGEIPEGLVLDHLCRVKHCVNPDHLEAVTSKINVIRGFVGKIQREKTHCMRGHKFIGYNTIKSSNGTRKCRTCHNARQRKHLGFSEVGRGFRNKSLVAK